MLGDPPRARNIRRAEDAARPPCRSWSFGNQPWPPRLAHASRRERAFYRGSLPVQTLLRTGATTTRRPESGSLGLFRPLKIRRHDAHRDDVLERFVDAHVEFDHLMAGHHQEK